MWSCAPGHFLRPVPVLSHSQNTGLTSPCPQSSQPPGITGFPQSSQNDVFLRLFAKEAGDLGLLPRWGLTRHVRGNTAVKCTLIDSTGVPVVTPKLRALQATDALRTEVPETPEVAIAVKR